MFSVSGIDMPLKIFGMKLALYMFVAIPRTSEIEANRFFGGEDYFGEKEE